MSFEALAFIGVDELHNLITSLTEGHQHSVGMSHAVQLSSDSQLRQEVGTDTEGPFAPDADMVPPGKVDGVDGGIVNDGKSRYWVPGSGHYQYTYGADGRVTDRRWIPDTETLKAFRLF